MGRPVATLVHRRHRATNTTLTSSTATRPDRRPAVETPDKPAITAAHTTNVDHEDQLPLASRSRGASGLRGAVRSTRFAAQRPYRICRVACTLRVHAHAADGAVRST
jgi:hypothetical protein